MDDSSADEGGGEAKMLAGDLLRPEASGVEGRPPKAPLSPVDANPLVGEGGGVDVVL